jgi:hypothetical protein
MKSTNPQRSSSSQALKSLRERKSQRMMKGGKSVEKSHEKSYKILKPMELEIPQDNHKHPQPCRRQVYSSLAVAESSASAMLRMGFLSEALVEKCSRCGLVHVREVRSGLAANTKNA